MSNRTMDSLPALPNHFVSVGGTAYQINRGLIDGSGGSADSFMRKAVKAVRLADALMARAQFRAVRLPSLEACTDYMLAADAGHVKPYDSMGGLPRLPAFTL